MNGSDISLNSDVVIRAIKKQIGDKPADEEQKSEWDVCEGLVLSQPTIRMSILAWCEVVWTTRPEERIHALEKLLPSLHDDQLSPEAVKLAVQLADEERKMPNYCTKCWGSDQSKPCPKCKRLSCREDKRNDLLILATAVVARGVHCLYAYDTGILHFKGHRLLNGLEVLRPEPNPQGMLRGVEVPPEARFTKPTTKKRR